MKFYRINDEYINFLKRIEPKTLNNYSGKRIYIGVVFTINSHKYFAPLSSHKESHRRIKKNDTIFRLHSRSDVNDRLGLIQLNNMIPVLDTELNQVIFSQEERKYGNLLRKQYEFIKSRRKNIEKQAYRLYHRVINNESFFVRMSCNFKVLEENYKNFNKEK